MVTGASFVEEQIRGEQGAQLHGIIQDRKANCVPVPFCLCEDAIFALALCFDTYPMLRQTAEHIFALSNIDGLAVDIDFINPGCSNYSAQPSRFSIA